MVAPGSIRAGAAYVEISADDTPMVRRLQESRARLARWVAEQDRMVLTRGTEGAALSGGRGFLSGGFKGMELAETGFRLATAIAATKVAIKDVQIFASLFRGDMEAARKAAEELPFGLGAIVKELSGPVDAAMKAFIFRLKGIQDTGPGRSNRRALLESVEQYNRGVTAIGAAQKALDKATMSAREYAEAEVRGMDLAATEARKLLALKLRLIETDEARKKAAEASASRETGERLVTEALDEFARLTMSERDFIAYQVRQLGLSTEQAESLLRLRQGNYDVMQEQKRVQEEINDLMAEEGAKAAEWYKNIKDAVDAEYAARDAAYDRAEAVRKGVRTPVEVARESIDELRRLHEEGFLDAETYGRAVRKAVEDAAAAMPDIARDRIETRGTFSAFGAAYLGTGGVTDRIARATEETARNTQKIAQLARDLGVTFN